MPTGTPDEARDHIAGLEKDLAKTKSALNTALDVNRGFAAKEAFTTEGFDPKFAALYTASTPDGELTPEAVQEWTKTFGIEPGTPPVVEGEPPKEPVVVDDGSENLASLGRGGSNPGGGGQPPTGKETMPIKEWQDLHAHDPDAANQAVADGRVELRADNPHLKRYSQRDNPYLNRGQPAKATE